MVIYQFEQYVSGMVRRLLSTYVPDRPPTWTEVGLAALVGVMFGSSVIVRRPRWPAVVVGFVVFALAVGPVATTSVGRRVGDWFRGIGTSGRTVVIGLFILTVAVASRTVPALMVLLGDAAYGGLAAVALFTTVHVAVAGEISGWRVD